MKCLATLLLSSLGVLLSWLCAAPAPAQPPAAKELDPKVVEAWRDAGALAGWLAQGESGEWQYLKAKPKGPASVPVFLWQKYERGVIAKLPAPSGPFAVGLGGTKMTDAGLKELAGFEHLRAVDLSHTEVTDAGLKELAAVKGLQELDLGATAVTDAGLKELAAVKGLRKLYFGSTKVADAGLKHLAGLKDLHTLYLYNTKVTDAGLKELAGLKSLRSLILVKTEVTDAGVADLRKALPDLKVER